jgi:glycoprotein endo-alpha-1,2-mannosidase
MYFYDSYLIQATDWATIFDPNAPNTIRNTKYDIVALGLYLDQKDRNTFQIAHFDGCYTYFAAEVDSFSIFVYCTNIERFLLVDFPHVGIYRG